MKKLNWIAIEKNKKKGKRKRQLKSFRFWVRVSKFKISHFLTHIDGSNFCFALFCAWDGSPPCPPTKKILHKKEKKKKNTRRRRDETKRMRRRSLRLLLFVAHVSLFSFSSSRGAECPLEIEKIDLNGLGNACGDATDPGKKLTSLLFFALVFNISSRKQTCARSASRFSGKQSQTRDIPRKK